jgi:hypothetical protein
MTSDNRGCRRTDHSRGFGNLLYETPKNHHIGETLNESSKQNTRNDEGGDTLSDGRTAPN